MQDFKKQDVFVVVQARVEVPWTRLDVMDMKSGLTMLYQ